MSELTNLVAKQNEESYQLGKKHGAIEELNKIKAEIYRHHNIPCNLKCATCFLEYNCELRRKIDLLEDLAIIDNHIKELKEESKENKTEVITRGNCMMCGKELTEGLFFCKECENKCKECENKANNGK